MLKTSASLIVACGIFIAITLFLSDDNFEMTEDLALTYELMHFFAFGTLTVFIYLSLNLDRLARVGLAFFTSCGLGLMHERVKILFRNEVIGFQVGTVDYWLVDCLGAMIFVIAVIIVDALFFKREDVDEYEIY